MNTIMVRTDWKKKQKFKVTLKRDENEGDRTQGLSQALSNFKLHQIHDVLSEVRCMHARLTQAPSPMASQSLGYRFHPACNVQQVGVLQLVSTSAMEWYRHRSILHSD